MVNSPTRKGGAAVYPDIESGANVTRVTFLIIAAMYSHGSLRVLQIGLIVKACDGLKLLVTRNDTLPSHARSIGSDSGLCVAGT